MSPFRLRRLLALAAIVGVADPNGPAFAQRALPTIEVGAAHRQRTTAPRRAATATPRSAPVSPLGAPAPSTVDKQTARLDRLLPKTGANVYRLDRSAIESLPQGNQATLDQILLQNPGVTQDSAAGGSFHVRNEHGNVQYRVNGILLPDGVSGGFSQVMDTGFIGSVSLITGALPAQYGLRTAGVVDIVSRPPPPTPGGNVSIYGGSHATGQSAFDYGAQGSRWEAFASGRLTMNNLGLQNTTPGHEALHDRTRQGRFFGFASYAIDESTKLSFITGTSVVGYQIPNNPRQQPQFAPYGVNWFDSGKLNENQVERTFYNVLALSKSTAELDAQISYFSRYSTVHYVPDAIGDLTFNGVASNVYRAGLVNGLQGDAAYRLGDHTLRGGFTVSGEQSKVINSSLVFPLDADGNPGNTPIGAYDPNVKLGWLAGVYAQDEWKLTDKLTLNGGLRFDQMWQFVTANQLSPRVSLTFKPVEDTTFHVGYARYFTPPSQALAAPTNLAVYANTTQQAEVPLSSPVRPERAHYIDVGVTQRLTPQLEAGVDFYYKRARNLLDDGQFGQAYVQTAFNYARAYNTGVELKALFRDGDFRAYANLAWARQRATQVTSNQFLFGSDEIDYISGHYIYTDHAQTLSGSAGASYVFWGTRGSVSMIYGSGLRSGFANTTHASPYTQLNLGLAREIGTVFDRPLTLRFDIVNLLDHAYQLRDGSGIGVFAPQYGPRRGFFVGLKQAF
ncbi:TonB-dependent receptor [Methylocystis sp. JR02]|uniref:TonB-dependent receptor n=1 Tax=Methylocystis sp. JR02 TaxID=3046284 RepID=UPI0024B9850C|nr:TonB-dependent receptor [Methylocystis sp. JR02]MDJ0447518.1 TonB-dependent receptor [Methylocystis sp. JR02]